MVVRAYVTGRHVDQHLDALRARASATSAATRSPDGLQQEPEARHGRSSRRAPRPTKGDHDVSASREEILAMGAHQRRRLRRAAELRCALFAFGAALLRSSAGSSWSTRKYEFGNAPRTARSSSSTRSTRPTRRASGSRAPTPSASPKGEDPESFDKEYVRRYLAEQGFKGDGPIPTVPDDVRVEAARRYIEAYETHHRRSVRSRYERAHRAPAQEPRRPLTLAGRRPKVEGAAPEKVRLEPGHEHRLTAARPRRSMARRVRDQP